MSVIYCQLLYDHSTYGKHREDTPPAGFKESHREERTDLWHSFARLVLLVMSALRKVHLTVSNSFQPETSSTHEHVLHEGV